MPLNLSVEKVRIMRTELRTRMPFKYGIATMTHLPHVFVEVILFVDGMPARGVAADHLPPKWFTKDPDRPVADEIREMERVIEQAASMAEGLQATSVFDLWLEVHRRMERWRHEMGLPALLVHFGTSLVERGVIDAFCRARRQPFYRAVHSDALGIRLEEIHPELRRFEASKLLPTNPIYSLFLRHTVGLADPIDGSDCTSVIDDGLPVTLEQNIAAYGLRHFKIKFTSLRDLPRLERIFGVIAAAGIRDVRITLDGNESFSSVEEFRVMWAAIESLPCWPELRNGLLCVEQPFHREIALAENTMTAASAWAERPPLIIDESDAEFDSVRRALDGGYVGTSHKNCKGVFRGIANACLLARRRTLRPNLTLLQTGEDLANIGPVALLQDLAVQAVLGNESVERNGHHYFAGLSIWPAEIQEATIAHHPDLYTRSKHGWPRLAVNDGRISTHSVVMAPFGVGPELRLDALTCEQSIS